MRTALAQCLTAQMFKEKFFHRPRTACSPLNNIQRAFDGVEEMGSGHQKTISKDPIPHSKPGQKEKCLEFIKRKCIGK